MTYLAYGFLLVLGVALEGFYSGSEMGLYTVNRFRLRKRQHAGGRSARLLAFLLADPMGLLITFLMGTNIAVYSVTAMVTHLYETAGLSPGGSWWKSPELAATASLALPLFIFAEVLPKNYFRQNAERISYPAAWGLAATKYLLYPLVLILRPLAALAPGPGGAHVGLGMPHLSRRTLDRLLSDGLQTGELTVEQERLARNVLRVGGRPVAELARAPIGAWAGVPVEQQPAPSVRTISAPADESAGKVLERMTAARTRLAMVLADGRGQEEGALLSGDVVGFVRLFDLLSPDAQGKSVRELARPAPRLPAGATLREALTAMQRECADVAVVEGPAPGAAGKKSKAKTKTPPAPEAEVDRPVLGVVRIAQLISELLGAPPPEEKGKP